MLSKVISGRGREHITAASFTASLPRPAPAAPPADSPIPDGETQALRNRIQQLEQELVSARRDSLESGRRQGEQQARAEIAPVIERINSSLADLVEFRSEMRRRAEHDVVQLALLIARRVLHREVSADPNALTALARVIFDRLARAESYRVTVHPSFVPAITAALPRNQTSRVQVEPDPHCAIGSLLIHSEEGKIDASIDSQLEEITRGLTDRLAQTGSA